MRYLIAFSLLLLTPSLARAQDCPLDPNGDLLLESQAQVDAAASCTSVSGSLIVRSGSNTPIGNLDGLGSIASVARNVSIEFNPALASLEGLGGLIVVGDNLIIQANGALTSLDGLAGITNVGGGIVVIDNSVLTSLDGLGAITSLSGRLDIRNNDALSRLNGLGALTRVEGFVNLSGNDALLNLDALGALTRVDEDLVVRSNAVLTDCAGGLAGLVSEGTFSGVSGTVTIADNLAGGNCTSPDQVLALVDAQTCPLDADGNLTLTSQAEVDAAAPCTSVPRSLTVLSDADTPITDLDALSGIGSIGLGLGVINNSALTSLDGLNAVTSVGGPLVVEFNAALTDCAGGLAGLVSEGTFSGVSGTVTIAGNLAGGNCTSPGQVLGLVATPNQLGAQTRLLALSAPTPHPVSGSSTIAFALPAAGPVRLTVYDLLGRERLVLAQGTRAAGEHAVRLSGDALEAGAYVYRLEAGGEVRTHRLIRVE